MTDKRTQSGHVEPEPEIGTTRDPMAEPRLRTPEKQTIYWMFDELDVSPSNRVLSTSELSRFEEEVKLSVGPRACAESFVSYCDYNKDGVISLGEWCWCNGLDNSKYKPTLDDMTFVTFIDRKLSNIPNLSNKKCILGSTNNT